MFDVSQILYEDYVVGYVVTYWADDWDIRCSDSEWYVPGTLVED